MPSKKKAGIMKAAARERKKAEAAERDLQRKQKLRERAVRRAEARGEVYGHPEH